VVLIMWIGLALFFLVPTVPPWLAAQQGELEGVTRVMDSTIRETLGDDDSGFPGGESTYDEFYAALGEPNSVAAMPSIHMAVTFAMYLWARRYARRLAMPLLLYTIVMGLALAYLGEHYIADEIAGIAVAVAAWALVLRTRWAPPPSQAAR
jgi:membrane-associated phospholipid phosphatase